MTPDRWAHARRRQRAQAQIHDEIARLGDEGRHALAAKHRAEYLRLRDLAKQGRPLEPEQLTLEDA